MGTSALIAAGRVIIADVLGEPGPPEDILKGMTWVKVVGTGKGEQPKRHVRRDTTWRIPLLGENSINEPLNQSPVTARQFARVMKRVVRLARKALTQWEQSFDAIENPASVPSPLKIAAPYYFVSYARLNSSDVKPICGELERLGFHLWFDESSIAGGEDFIASIIDGIEGCEAVISFCSREYSSSKTCLREVRYADELGKRVCPAWLTNPALFREMKFILGIYNAALVGGMTPPAAAARIRHLVA